MLTGLVLAPTGPVTDSTRPAPRCSVQELRRPVDLLDMDIHVPRSR
jgi:hypothetical protein